MKSGKYAGKAEGIENSTASRLLANLDLFYLRPKPDKNEEESP